MCRYSDLPDMYNQCKFAHNQLELDEWKERWEWRQMKRRMAREQGLYSYMESLLEDFDSAESPVTVVRMLVSITRSSVYVNYVACVRMYVCK